METNLEEKYTIYKMSYTNDKFLSKIYLRLREKKSKR